MGKVGDLEQQQHPRYTLSNSLKEPSKTENRSVNPDLTLNPKPYSRFRIRRSRGAGDLDPKYPLTNKAR